MPNRKSHDTSAVPGKKMDSNEENKNRMNQEGTVNRQENRAERREDENSRNSTTTRREEMNRGGDTSRMKDVRTDWNE